MAESQVRGYMLSTTAGYIRHTAKERGIADPTEQLSPSLRTSLANVASAGWYPVAHIAELNQLIASALANNDEERAKTDLQSCGRYMAEEATNTFMRLMMRVLTPSLFAKKLPELWRRDCMHGKLDLEVEDRCLTLLLNDMTGHDHIAAIMPGYVGFALEKMGKEVERVTLDGWSLAKPDGSGAKIQFFWRK